MTEITVVKEIDRMDKNYYQPERSVCIVRGIDTDLSDFTVLLLFSLQDLRTSNEVC